MYIYEFHFRLVFTNFNCGVGGFLTAPRIYQWKKIKTYAKHLSLLKEW